MNAILTLWNRAKTYGALPAAGGLMDQDDRLMSHFDAIENEFSAARKQQEGNRVAEIEKERMMREIRG